ncbi:MAG: tetraacyldisaccharide 4'-kinase [Pseudomonadota bacterium]
MRNNTRRNQLRAKLEQSLNESWYGDKQWTRRLRPLSSLYRTLARLNKPSPKDVYDSPLPVIVIGNITVGGAGKTPLVIHVCELMQRKGWRPAVLSRGYKSTLERYPHIVGNTDDAAVVGDEPLMLSRRLDIPVCIDPQRSRGARLLLARQLCNVIVCDDGLQHYKLARDIEVAVLDGQRMLGNGLCLPAGPLREPSTRLDGVDFIVCNGEPADSVIGIDAVMQIEVECFVNLKSDQRLSPIDFVEQNAGAPLHALAAIGNPERFFASLDHLGFVFDRHAFPDHHAFEPGDLAFGDNKTLLMTEKDAVKCKAIAGENCWFMQVSARVTEKFDQEIIELLEAASGAYGKNSGQASAR